MKMWSSETWKSMKKQVESLVNVLARVPFFLMIDACDDIEAGGKWRTVLAAVGYMVSVVGVFTRIELLLTFYCWLIEMIFVICLFYAVNYVSGNASAKTKDPNTRFPDTVLNHVFSQSHLYAQVLTTASIALSSRKKWTELKSSWTLMMFFILPFGIQILFSPFNQSSEVIYGICLVFLCCLTLFVLYEAFKVMLRGLELLKETLESCRLMIENFGWITFMMHHWDRANVTKVMLISWWAKFVYILSTRYGFSWFSIFASFGDCCNSAISLLAASIVVAEMSKCVLELVRKSLQGQGPEQNEDEILNGGWNEGVSFFLLGFQTDIISAKSEERSLIISLIIFVTSSLLIQSAFEMVEPVLVSLGATYTGSINWRHMRALAMSVLILIIPSYLIYTICITFEFDSWLFIIISSNVVTLVQMIGALTVYGLFIMNAHSESSWENLDDYVYYINAICKVFEFFMAVVVVLYSGWATVTGEWDLVGSAVICMHAYFNVYKRAQEGWKNFLLRRSAVHRLNSLQWATTEQLAQHDDVCAICYDELKSARVTRCNHFFHSMCLRKWLYVQSKCPLCHKDIMPED